MHTYFADVLLPLPLQGLFTYRIPQELNDHVGFGMRVVVPFGKSKLYSGLVLKVHENVPQQVNVKYVLDVIDEHSVVSEHQIQLWQWIANYYMCSLGEVMAAAFPSALKLASETKIQLNPAFDGDMTVLNEKETKLVEALAYHPTMTVDEIAKTIDIQKVIPIIKSLVDKDVVITDEEIRDPYKPKTETFIALAAPYCDDEAALMNLIDSLGASKKTAKQQDLLLAFLMQTKDAAKPNGFNLKAVIKKADLLKKADISQARLQTLIDKGIFEQQTVVTSRLEAYDSSSSAEDIQFTEHQQQN